MDNLLIFIPTYNEKENVKLMIKELTSLPFSFDMLFIDDNSPDGTGKILEALKAEYKNLSVIHRAGKLGIGSAHKTGIDYAFKNGYDYLLTMDCDFSHSPSDIGKFLQHKDFDLVIGTRYSSKESLKEWNFYRKFLTNLGHFLTKKLLMMSFDATGAFRLYNLKKIRPEDFYNVKSEGYSFFFESLFFLNLKGYSIKEIPIILPKRTYGSSKMSIIEIFKSLYRLVRLFLYRIKAIR